MAKVFISYSRKDIGFAKKLTDELQKSDLDFWIDWEGIPPTVDWWKEIEKGIEEADVFLFLISPDSAKSKVCGQEIDSAIKNGKRLIPLIVRDIKGEEAPPQLSHLNWIFFRESDDFEAALNKLMTAIQTDYEWAANHRRLQVKALEWERNNKEKSFLLRGKDLQDAELQLAINTSKEPHPTDLQREYVFESRQATDRQRRVTTGIAIAGIIALAALAVFGFVQAKLATDRANTALSRLLSSQAQTILATRNSKQMIADLLAIQSMKIVPSSEAAQILLNNNFAARAMSRMPHDDLVGPVAFSPDGKYAISGSADGAVSVWDSLTGKEVAHMNHDNALFSVAFSQDGNYVVSASLDHTARVWEVATAREVARMTHADAVNDAFFSPDGKYVISGSDDGTARVWEAATGREVARMTQDGPIRAMAVSKDGRYVVSGSFDGTARMWETATGKEVARMTHGIFVMNVALSTDGKYAASAGSLDITVRVWEAATGREITRLTQGFAVTVITFSPDGRYVATAGYGGAVRVWETDTGREVAKMSHDGPVNSITFSPDGRYIVSGSADGTAVVWESSTGQEVARMTHESEVTSVAFSPQGRFVLTGSGNTAQVWEASAGTVLSFAQGVSVTVVAMSLDGNYLVSGECDTVDERGVVAYCSQSSAHVWETSTGQEITHFTHVGDLKSVTLSPNGNNILSVWCVEFDEISNCAKHVTYVWDVTTGTELAHMTHEDRMEAFVFSPDGNYVATGGFDGTARVWEAATGREIARLTHENYVTSIAFSPHGRYVVSGSAEGMAIVWEAATGKEMARMIHDGEVASVAFSPDGKFVVSGSGDATARVWEATSGKEISRFTHDGGVTSVAFSPDGKFAVSGSWDNTARVWEVATGKEAARMAHDDAVISVVFSPDGKYVLSEGADNTRIWEAATGQELARMTVGSSFAFSPDGNSVISGGGDGIRFWEWQPEDLIKNACAALPRNLTRAEWEQYIGDSLPYQAVCDNLPIEGEIPSGTTDNAGEGSQDPSVQTNELPVTTEEVFATEEPLAKTSPSPILATPRLETTATSNPAALKSYFHLTTKLSESTNKCLEGNQVANSSFLGGAAFMDDCADVTGQFWKMIPADNGYFHLTTALLESRNKCLEGNRVANDSFLGGAAFMDDCTDLTGQLWKKVPADDNYFYLTTKFLESQSKCLEGNRVANDSFLGGAVFMDDCTGVTGQLWTLNPSH